MNSIIIFILIITDIFCVFKYLGIEGYGEINRTIALNPKSQIYRFLNENVEKKYKIYPGDIINQTDTGPNYDIYKCEDGAYPIQNRLIEGYEYNLTIEDNIIKEIVQITKTDDKYEPPIKYTPGLRTLKNFISAAFQPLGTTLYVFGGGWDFQDIGTANEGRTNGISPYWVKFFDDHDANYTYKDWDHKNETYYPFGGFNEYYYAGLDCSGYVGWSIYNNIHNTSLTNEGFVTGASKIAFELFKKKYGKWMHNVEGSNYTNPNYTLLAKEVKVGDILSTSGHVMIVLGKCNDSSFIIMHSTPSDSKTGFPGGGVQLSAVNPKDNSINCEAYNLCKQYMEKYFKKWSTKYNVIVSRVESVFNFDDKVNYTGLLHWDLENGIITDPDNYILKSANEILSDLFNNSDDTSSDDSPSDDAPSKSSSKNKVIIILISVFAFILIIIIIIIIIIKTRKTKKNNEIGDASLLN